MICKYDNSDDEDSFEIYPQEKTRCRSIPKKEKKSPKNISSNQDEKTPDFIIEGIMKMINTEDEPVIKKRNYSPTQRYSKRNIRKKLRDLDSSTNLELSRSSAVSVTESLKSIKLGKNFILKQYIPSSKFHTPFMNPYDNPLLNYFKKQNISPKEIKLQQSSDIEDTSQSPYTFNGMEELKFPFAEDKNNLYTAAGIKFGSGAEYTNFFQSPTQNVGSRNIGTPNSTSNKGTNSSYINNDNSGINGSNPNEFLPLHFFDKGQTGNNGLNSSMSQNGSNVNIGDIKEINLSPQQTSTSSTAKKNNFSNIQLVSDSTNENESAFKSHFPFPEPTESSKESIFQTPKQEQQNQGGFFSLQSARDEQPGFNLETITRLNKQIKKTTTNIKSAETKNLKKPKEAISLTNPNNITDQEIITNARQLASEQNGCRYIQKRLETNPSIGAQVFDALEEDLLILSCGSFGNYLLQKLLSVIDMERVGKFIDIVTPFFVKVAISSHGTRVIQKLIDIIKNTNDLINKISDILNKNLMEITMDANSNHIIQKYVSVIKYPLNATIYDNIIQNFLSIAKDKYGCCMMQKCIECGTQEQKNKLIYLSIQNSQTLITDQYGNYVLQYIVKLDNQECNSAIISLILTNLKKYCSQKFSSNVIEKCLEHSYPEYQNMLITAIVSNENLVSELMIDLFGNYIIQKILMIVKGNTYYTLLGIIAKNADRIRRVSFGNRVLTKLMSLHNELCFMMSATGPQMAPMVTAPYNAYPSYNMGPINTMGGSMGNMGNINKINSMGGMPNLNTMNAMGNPGVGGFPYLMRNERPPMNQMMFNNKNMMGGGDIKVNVNNNVNLNINNIRMFKANGK